MSPKTRNIIGWVLTGLIAAFFLWSASMALMPNAESIKMGESMGLNADSFRMLGIIEVVSVILFAIPRTGVLGTLLFTAYLGGAIATHLEHAQPFTMAAVVLAIIWITALVRFPELGRRLFGAKMTL